MSIHQVTSDEEFEQKTASGLVVVDFFATWCGPCKRVAPALKRFAAEYEGRVSFLKVDVDEMPEVTEENEITAMPTFVFFKDGSEVARVMGAAAEKIKAKIDQLL
ncbi:MAG: hypothetical protein MHM6MM_002816 [Cercozoa sp. M6MM]